MAAAKHPSPPTAAIRALAPGGWGLCVEFDRHDDRHGHRVAVVTPAGCIELLESREGDVDALWPPSPPLQQLSVEQRPSGAVALAVGMAGRHHWSVSVEAVAEAATVVFDAACRAASERGPLGSRYTLREPPQLLPNSALWRRGEFIVRLETEHSGDAPARVEAADAELAIVPRRVDQPTIRWRYALRCTPAEPLS